MTIQTATKDEQSIGIAAWLRITKDAFAAALTLQVPDRLQRNILNAIKYDGDDSEVLGIPLSKDEATILRAAGI